ncbi:hypothetical protein HYW46_01600 [Candidatus Daviesbacteria bacterium]|nr:hypothetical protein [Candidatus Daviesbacteria bacterium]
MPTEQENQSPAEKPRKIIKSSGELAKTLGYTRNPFEKPTTWYRTYEKPVDTPLGRGFATFAIQDLTYEPSERMYIGVTLSQEPTAWATAIDLLQKSPGVKGELKDEIRHGSKFDKSALRLGGYNKVAQILLQLEEEGYFAELLTKLLEGRENTQRVAELLLAKFNEAFPEFKVLHNLLDIEHLIQLIGPPAKNGKTARVINLKTYQSLFAINIGKIRLNEPFKKPVNLRESSRVGEWRFEIGDSEEGGQAAEDATVLTLAYLNQKRETITRWSFKEKKLDDMAKVLGFNETGELAKLRNRLVLDMLSKKDYSEDAAEYRDAAEALINQKQDEDSGKAQIGLILAQARIYHLAGRDASEEIQDAISYTECMQDAGFETFDNILETLRSF